MRFLAKFFRRWYLYIPLVIILPILGTVYGIHRLSVYQSQALVYINNPSAIYGSNNNSNFDQYLSPAQNGANAMNEAMLSESFLVDVAKNTALAKSYDLNSQQGRAAVSTRLLSEITVTASAVGMNTLFVTVDDENPHLAQSIADQLIKQFTIYFSQSQITSDQMEEAFLQQQIDSAKSKVSQDQAHVTQYLQQHPGLAVSGSAQAADPTYASLQQQLTQDQDNLSGLNSKLSSVRFDMAAASNGVSSIFIVRDAPQVPITTTLQKKKLLIYSGGGLALALALIALIVGLQTMMDHKVYTSTDIRDILEDMELEIPSVETVPLLRTNDSHSNSQSDSQFAIDGVLLPVLTALPQLSGGGMTAEIRDAIGIAPEHD